GQPQVKLTCPGIGRVPLLCLAGEKTGLRPRMMGGGLTIATSRQSASYTSAHNETSPARTGVEGALLSPPWVRARHEKRNAERQRIGASACALEPLGRLLHLCQSRCSNNIAGDADRSEEH